jgi:hypothetical protein
MFGILYYWKSHGIGSQAVGHVRPRCTVDCGSEAESTTRKCYGSPAVAARGIGGRRGHGGAGGALTGDATLSPSSYMFCSSVHLEL